MNLTNHAVEIRRHHDAARAAAVTAIEHALAAGQILTQVKEGLPHGEFGNWVTTQCGFSERMARRYMQLHTHRDALPEGAGVKAALEHMTVLKLIAKTDTVSEMVTSTPEVPVMVRPTWLPTLGKAAKWSDQRGRCWYAWELLPERLADGDGRKFACAMVITDTANGGFSEYTKRGIRFDWLEETLAGFGLLSSRLSKHDEIDAREAMAQHDYLRELDQLDWSRKVA